MENKTPLFTEINQIAFVVPELYRAMDALYGGFGLGPFELMRFGDPGDGSTNLISIENVVLHGRDTGTYAILQGHCPIPGTGVELELIQPLTGESVFAEFLSGRGKGVQHISIVHGDFDISLEKIKSTGHELSQIASVDKVETCVFSDYRDVLGTWLELHRRPADFCPPDIELEVYPSGTEKKEPKPLGAVRLRAGVGDAQKAARLLAESYGLAPVPGKAGVYALGEVTLELCSSDTPGTCELYLGDRLVDLG